MKRHFKNHLNKGYTKLISLKGEPESLAFGLAIGVFVGVTPTIPLHTALIVLVCLLLKKNITAGLLGSWLISNPLTIPLFYVTQYRLGKFMLGNASSGAVPQDYSLFDLMQKGFEVVVPLLAGGIVMAPFFAIPAFFIARSLILAVREHRHDHGKEHP